MHITNQIKQDINGNIKEFELIQEKWGVYVYRCKYEDIPAVVKYFEVDWAKREIKNYRLLNDYNIPTIKILSYGESSIVMEDISLSDNWRMGIVEDFNDAIVAEQLAHWYFSLHEQGLDAVKANPALTGEYSNITEKNINMLYEKLPEASETFLYLLSRYKRLREIIDMLEHTLTYNDFYWSNFIVRKDKQAAVMFDYNMLGKGFRYSDMRNVCWSLSEEAGKMFIDEYKRLYIEKYGTYREAEEAREKQIDDVASSIYSLYFAVSMEHKRDIENGKQEFGDGTFLKMAKNLLE